MSKRRRCSAGASLIVLAAGLGVVPANLVVVPVGTDGSVQLYNDAGSTHVVADVAGWYLA
jgi:hypothetical protein